MSIQNTIKHDAAMAAWDYIGKNPEENIPKVLDQVEKLDVNGTLSQHIAGIRRTFADPDNGMRKLALSLWEDIDPEQRRVLFEGLAVNSMLTSAPVRAKAREKYQCNIPWAILMDLTSACNLQCTGCWAAEYGHSLNVVTDELAGAGVDPGNRIRQERVPVQRLTEISVGLQISAKGGETVSLLLGASAA